MTDSDRNEPDARAAVREAHQALAILRTLEQEVSGTLADPLLTWALGRYALAIEREALHALLDRLERQGFVVRVEGAPSVIIVRLTEKGSRVAQGEERAEGVMRVFPDCPY